MKIFLSGVVLSVCASAVYAEQPEEIQTITSPASANLTFASQYISRGFQQTWGKPAIQGGLDYNHASGFFAGTWASNVSSRLIRDASMEWDVYTGYLKTINDFTVGATVYYYYYPGAKTTAETGNTRFNYGEVIPQLGYGPLSVKYAVTYTPDYFGDNSDTLGGPAGKHSRGSGYLDVNLNQPLGQGWSAIAHYGHMDVKNFSEANFHDMKLAIAKDLGDGWNTNLAYTKAWDKDNFYKASSNGNPDAYVSNPINATFTISVNKVF